MFLIVIPVVWLYRRLRNRHTQGLAASQHA